MRSRDIAVGGVAGGGMSLMPLIILVYVLLTIYSLVIAVDRTESEDPLPRMVEIICACIAPIVYIIVKN